jgi:hypothetical protein
VGPALAFGVARGSARGPSRGLVAALSIYKYTRVALVYITRISRTEQSKTKLLRP